MSKKDKLSVVRIDKFIPLISDVLPFEVPLSFSNNNIYRLLRDKYQSRLDIHNIEKAKGNELNNFSEDVLTFFRNYYIPTELDTRLPKNFDTTIPYKYCIRKADNDYREIAIMHPFIQMKVCNFYEKYKDLIIYNCTKSKYSLRYPAKVSKLIHRSLPKIKAKLIQMSEMVQATDIQQDVIEDNIAFEQSDLISNFFIYKKYGLLYKFFDSQELLNLEPKYKYYSRIDISRCFNSIYTHSISWAIKDKEYIKNNIERDKRSFAHYFDYEIMQNSNYKETNGILIGSEVSRIFAEIIFQDVDVKVENLLKSKSIDYKIFRYVDDYFIFYNDNHIFIEIKNIIAEELKKYNLFLNENKECTFIRPFISDTQKYKIRFKPLIKEFLNSYYTKDSDLRKIRFNSNRCKSAFWLLDSVRMLMSETKAPEHEIVNYTLATIKKELINILYKLKSKNVIQENILSFERYIKSLIEVSFYVYNIYQKTSTTYNLYKIGFLLLEIIDISDLINKNRLKDFLQNELLKTLEKIKKTNNKILIEQLDLIMLLRHIELKPFVLSEEFLEALFQIDKTAKFNLSYFEIIILLDYIKSDTKYIKLKQYVLDNVITLYQNIYAFKYTEKFMLFFDLIKCPFIDISDKKRLLNNLGINPKEHKSIIDGINQVSWYYCWNEKISMPKILTVKELQNKYV